MSGGAGWVSVSSTNKDGRSKCSMATQGSRAPPGTHGMLRSVAPLLALITGRRNKIWRESAGLIATIIDNRDIYRTRKQLITNMCRTVQCC